MRYSLLSLIFLSTLSCGTALGLCPDDSLKPDVALTYKLPDTDPDDWEYPNDTKTEQVNKKVLVRARITERSSALKNVQIFMDPGVDETLVMDDPKIIASPPIFDLEISIGPELSTPGDVDYILGYVKTKLFIKAVTIDDCETEKSIAFQGGHSGVQAVVIGISRYENVNELNYADKDAELVAEFLERQYGDALKLKVLPNERATFDSIAGSVKQASKEMSEHGTLIIYFSGHGMLQREHRDKPVKAYLVPYNGNNNNVGSLIDKSVLLNEWFFRSAARKKIFVFDACFSGAPTGVPREHESAGNAKLISKFAVSQSLINAAQRSVDLFMVPRDMIGMMSSNGTQFSYEKGGTIQNGIFTEYLIESAEEYVTQADGEVSFAEAISYIEGKIRDLHGNAQSPMLHANHPLQNITWAKAPVTTETDP